MRLLPTTGHPGSNLADLGFVPGERSLFVARRRGARSRGVAAGSAAGREGCSRSVASCWAVSSWGASGRPKGAVVRGRPASSARRQNCAHLVQLRTHCPRACLRSECSRAPPLSVVQWIVRPACLHFRSLNVRLSVNVPRNTVSDKSMIAGCVMTFSIHVSNSRKSLHRIQGCRVGPAVDRAGIESLFSETSLQIGPEIGAPIIGTRGQRLHRHVVLVLQRTENESGRFAAVALQPSEPRL